MGGTAGGGGGGGGDGSCLTLRFLFDGVGADADGADAGAGALDGPNGLADAEVGALDGPNGLEEDELNEPKLNVAEAGTGTDPLGPAPNGPWVRAISLFLRRKICILYSSITSLWRRTFLSCSKTVPIGVQLERDAVCLT